MWVTILLIVLGLLPWLFLYLKDLSSKKKQVLLEWRFQKEALSKSFNRFGKVLLGDFLVAVFVGLGIALFLSILIFIQATFEAQSGFSEIKSMLAEDLENPALENLLKQNVDLVIAFAAQVIIVALIALAILTFFWSLGKRWIWEQMTGKSPGLGKFYVLNLIIAMLLLSLLLLSAFLIEQPAVLALFIIALIAVSSYFIFLGYYVYMHCGAIGKTIKETVIQGIVKLPKLSFAYGIVFIVYAPLDLLFVQLARIPTIGFIINIAVLFVFFAWIKLYLVQNYNKIITTAQV
ncbi:hypothetical protein J4464_06570 [Candidatus Woesearchaeota archaeon]|nr:hypothetical protein [Candidatus Woesearchaeota archaeon]